MTIEFETTLDDIFAFNIYNHSISPTLRRSVQIGRIAYPVIFAASLVSFFVYFSKSLNVTILALLVLFSLVVGGIFFMLYPKLIDMRIKNLSKKLYNEGKNAGIMEKRAITITPTNITYSSRLSQGVLTWEAIEKIGQTDHHLFLYTSAMSAIVIPRRVLASDQEWINYTDTMKSYYAAARDTLTTPRSSQMPA